MISYGVANGKAFAKKTWGTEVVFCTRTSFCAEDRFPNAQRRLSGHGGAAFAAPPGTVPAARPNRLPRTICEGERVQFSAR